jgi:hypothetical protein
VQKEKELLADGPGSPHSSAAAEEEEMTTMTMTTDYCRVLCFASLTLRRAAADGKRAQHGTDE